MDGVRSLWDISKHANTQVIGLPEGEEEQQEIENLFQKKIMKANFPNMVKEIDIQVQEARGAPNKLDPERNTLRHIIIKMPEIKDRGKERILKAAREKQSVNLQRSSHKTVS